MAEDAKVTKILGTLIPNPLGLRVDQISELLKDVVAVKSISQFGTETFVRFLDLVGAEVINDVMYAVANSAEVLLSEVKARAVSEITELNKEYLEGGLQAGEVRLPMEMEARLNLVGLYALRGSLVFPFTAALSDGELKINSELEFSQLMGGVLSYVKDRVEKVAAATSEINKCNDDDCVLAVVGKFK